MVKKQKCPPLDEHLFRQEMDGVVPLKAPQTTDSRAPRTTPKKREREPELAISVQNDTSSAGEAYHIDTDDSSSHRKNGVQKRVMQKLKRGQYPVTRQLDLHQMTTDTGRWALLEFIAEARNKSPECVRVIHGKGLRSRNGPRLKSMTRQVLRNHPRVLAFTACKPADGGDGALDVLLKSP